MKKEKNERERERAQVKYNSPSSRARDVSTQGSLYRAIPRISREEKKDENGAYVIKM